MQKLASAAKTMLSVRPACDTDLPLLSALLDGSGLPVDDLTVAHLHHFIVVVDDGATLVGCVGIEPYGDSALLRSLTLHHTIRGAGWGQKLTGLAEDYARGVGISGLYLLTTTATEFFKKRGYHVIQRTDAPESLQATSEFTSLCPSQAVCLYKALPFIKR